jgi:ferredoxin
LIKLCRKCVAVCPTDAIWEVNLPARRVKPIVKKATEDKTKVDLIKVAKENSEKKTENKDNKTE